MTKNIKAFEPKPSNLKVIDIKPVNKAAMDAKSKIRGILTEFGTEQYYELTLRANMPMGLLLTLTYPTSITIQSSHSP